MATTEGEFAETPSVRAHFIYSLPKSWTDPKSRVWTTSFEDGGEKVGLKKKINEKDTPRQQCLHARANMMGEAVEDDEVQMTGSFRTTPSTLDKTPAPG